MVFERHWTCALCGCIAETPIVMDPCGHLFCYGCLENQGHHEKCRSCGIVKDTTYRCAPITEFVPEYEEVINAFQTVRKTFILDVQQDPTERVAEELAKQKAAKALEDEEKFAKQLEEESLYKVSEAAESESVGAEEAEESEVDGPDKKNESRTFQIVTLWNVATVDQSENEGSSQVGDQDTNQ